MNSCWGNTILFRSSQQLFVPVLCVASRHHQVCRAWRGDSRTPSTTTDANLDCAFVENALADTDPWLWKVNRIEVELVTRPDTFRHFNTNSFLVLADIPNTCTRTSVTWRTWVLRLSSSRPSTGTGARVAGRATRATTCSPPEPSRPDPRSPCPQPQSLACHSYPHSHQGA